MPKPKPRQRLMRMVDDSPERYAWVTESWSGTLDHESPQEYMKKQTPYYSTLSELARFAVGCEEDAATQPIEEIEENLTRQGIDVADLKATTLRRIKRLKNRMQANEAGLRIVTAKRESLTVVEMYQRLQVCRKHTSNLADPRTDGAGCKHIRALLERLRR